MPPAAPVMSAMRPSRSGADMGLPIEWRGKFLDHLDDFARAVTPVPQTRSNSAICAANAAEFRMFSASSTLGNS